MPSVNIHPDGAISRTATATASATPAPRGASSRPGLVQNCPVPRVKDSTKPRATSCTRPRPARVRTTGLIVPISAKTGNDNLALVGKVPQRHTPALGTGEGNGGDLRRLHDGICPAAKPATVAKQPSGAPAPRNDSTAISASRWHSAGCAG